MNKLHCLIFIASLSLLVILSNCGDFDPDCSSVRFEDINGVDIEPSGQEVLYSEYSFSIFFITEPAGSLCNRAPPIELVPDVAEIRLRSSSQFDADHPPGSELLGLFDIHGYGNPPFTATERHLIFMLNSRPAVVDTFTFEVQIDLTDSRSFTLFTNPVVITLGE